MAEVSTHHDLIDESVTVVMSAPVLSVLDDATLLGVLAAMVRAGRRHMAVVDTVGQCHGVIGDRAIAAAWADDPSALAFLPARRLLDARPPIVGTDATVRDVARLMYTDAEDAVVVVDRHGRPIGMVTSSDLIALIARAIPTTHDVGRDDGNTSSESVGDDAGR